MKLSLKKTMNIDAAHQCLGSPLLISSCPNLQYESFAILKILFSFLQRREMNMERKHNAKSNLIWIAHVRKWNLIVMALIWPRVHK